MKILVTGCCGYIGGVLTEHLAKAGHTVWGIDYFRHGNQDVLERISPDNFIFFYNDVRWPGTRELRLLKECDVFIPLAGLVGEKICREHPEEATQVNTTAILAALKHLSPAQRVIYPNTNSGYGRGENLTEDAPMNPLSHYARTKCETEKAILDRPNSVSLRLATVYGLSPRMRFDLLVNDFTSRLWLGETLKLYQPEYRRSIVHIEDVARAFVKAVDLPDGPYNVAGENWTKGDLAERIHGLMDQPARIEYSKTGHDPDGRDYSVSSKKLLSQGFSFEGKLYLAVEEIAQYLKDQARRVVQESRNR